MSFISNLPQHKRAKLLDSPDVEKLYTALKNDDDEAVAVITALELLKKFKLIPKVGKVCKCQELSLPCRLKGNNCFLVRDYHSALQFYNLAIGSAPRASPAFLLALSNRSALLQKIHAYTASLQDIVTCLTLNCPPNILSKLNQRKIECRRKIAEENSKKAEFECDNANKFFDFTDERHPQIPCVSKSVDVVSENSKYKVVAAKDIPPGTMVGLETAFASNLHSMNYYFACHYCHKMTFNLITCDTCCETLFCSDECKERCNNEFHNIECQMIDVIKDVFPEDKYRVPLKAALRMKYLSRTWEELIASTKMSKKSTNLSVSEIYDANKVQSVMSLDKAVKNFVYGQRFNHSFIVAIMIHYLHKIPGFFPLGKELKAKAVRTFCQILMHLIPLNQQFLPIQDAALIYPKMDVTCEPYENTGVFSFTNKLTHACDPNLLVVGHLNKVALISTKTITKGTELTISYAGHWLEKNYNIIRPVQLVNTDPGCRCRVCKEEWSAQNLLEAKDKMTTEQREYLGSFIMQSLVAEGDARKRMFSEVCRGLAVLGDMPNTKEYFALFTQFRILLAYRQYLASHNEAILN